MNNIKFKRYTNNTVYVLNGEIVYSVDTDEVYGFANGVWVDLTKQVKDDGNLDNIVYNTTTNKFQKCINGNFIDLN